jgi:hypothetical protein
VFLSGKAPLQRAMLEQLLTPGQPVMAFEETDDRSFPGNCIVRQDNAGGSQAFGAARHGRQGSVDGADIVTGLPEQPCRRRAPLVEEGADLSLLRPALADTGSAVFARQSHGRLGARASVLLGSRQNRPECGRTRRPRLGRYAGQVP